MIENGGAMKKDFTISESLSFGWDIMKQNLWFFIGILLVSWIVTGIPRSIAEQLGEDHAGIAVLFQIIYLFAQTVISIGLITITLTFQKGKKPEFGDLFRFQGKFWRFFFATLLYGLLIVAGFILLIVPGVYWALKYQYVAYCVVDRNASIMDSFRQSAHITESVKWKLLGFGILLGLINILGLICLFIGIFAAAPTTMMAYVFVYKKLLEQTPEEMGVAASAGVPVAPPPEKIKKVDSQ
jgi:hypothetical protein